MKAQKFHLWIRLLFFFCNFWSIPTAAWNYENTHWTGTCESGQRQSPVNLDFAKAVPTYESPLKFYHYEDKGPTKVINNGHTVAVDGFQSWTEKPYITGGGLRGIYYLRQFHFHWGDVDSTGSEHTLALHHYPMEVHFVHFLEGYNETAAGEFNGAVAVFLLNFLFPVAVMVRIGTEKNVLSNLGNAFLSVNGSKGAVDVDFSPAELLPNDVLTFFRYKGSLTTPPCTEGVIWTVLVEPTYAFGKELMLLRNLLTTDDHHLTHNWREAQPLNNRTIYLNREPSKLATRSYAMYSCIVFLVIFLAL